MGKSSKQQSGSTKIPKFLAYGLLRSDNSTQTTTIDCDSFELIDAPIASPLSFLDFDGVVVFAGGFEVENQSYMGTTAISCAHSADLDLRERQSFSLLKSGKPILFLVSYLKSQSAEVHVQGDCDLFRRFTARFGIQWRAIPTPVPLNQSNANEFNDYLGRFGSGYIRLYPHSSDDGLVQPLFVDDDDLYGAVLGRNLFFLPCTFPRTHDDLVEAAKEAIHAVNAYQDRVSEEMPEWVNDFKFDQESSLLARLDELYSEVADTTKSLDIYNRMKGGLIFQSSPLVEVIKDIFSHFFDLKIKGDEKYIDDGCLFDENDQVIAVLEIKGVKGSFTRQHVNQLDSHRERLGVPPQTPGILIGNVNMTAASLTEKDQKPHPDIIKKASQDHVLLIRTLDLLKCANAVERKVLSKDEFRTAILIHTGWLRFDSGRLDVVNQ